MSTRVGQASDIEGILVLQERNLYTNLSESERANGFVTTPFTKPLIHNLLSQTGVFVVENNAEIFGYAFAGNWEFFSQWSIFPFMLSRLTQLQYKGKQIPVENSFQYGPVCLDHSLRGSGVFSQLFATMRFHFASRFPIGVTFINRLNPRSLAAHTRKLDLEIIDEFEFEGRSYYSLAFETIPSDL